MSTLPQQDQEPEHEWLGKLFIFILGMAIVITILMIVDKLNP